jgi:hypothetical protein
MEKEAVMAVAMDQNQGKKHLKNLLIRLNNSSNYSMFSYGGGYGSGGYGQQPR